MKTISYDKKIEQSFLNDVYVTQAYPFNLFIKLGNDYLAEFSNNHNYDVALYFDHLQKVFILSPVAPIPSELTVPVNHFVDELNKQAAKLWSL